MPIERKNYKQIVNDILRRLTESYEEFIYVKNRGRYILPERVIDIVGVEGFSNGLRKMFRRDVDYRFSENFIEWIDGGSKPDEGSKFTVIYKSQKPEITDTNPGSVVRTVIEAIAREIEYLNELIYQAYLSGFIDTSSGESLDLVVSLLGIRRKPPQPASGYVTFGRRTEPETLQVSGEVILYNGSVEYSLRNRFIKDILNVKGVTRGSPTIYRRNIDYLPTDGGIRWLPSGNIPDEGSTFTVDYVAYREITIPKGVKVSTYSPRPEEARVYVTVEDAVLKPTVEGLWEANVPVVCTTPGSWGNVLAGTVKVLPQPLMGVEYVINKSDITGGLEEEGDRELRDRAKHALELAGKATISSLETAVKSIEGVGSVLVKDRPDGAAGIVKVIADGGDSEKILEAIELTRAAGIKVEFSRPKTVYIDIYLTLTVSRGVYEADVSRRVEELIRSYISSLGIGSSILFSRIVALALGVEGVLDVSNVRIVAYRAGFEAVESERENIEIGDEEKALARNIKISFRRG